MACPKGMFYSHGMTPYAYQWDGCPVAPSYNKSSLHGDGDKFYPRDRILRAGLAGGIVGLAVWFFTKKKTSSMIAGAVAAGLLWKASE